MLCELYLSNLESGLDKKTMEEEGEGKGLALLSSRHLFSDSHRRCIDSDSSAWTLPAMSRRSQLASGPHTGASSGEHSVACMKPGAISRDGSVPAEPVRLTHPRTQDRLLSGPQNPCAPHRQAPPLPPASLLEHWRVGLRGLRPLRSEHGWDLPCSWHMYTDGPLHLTCFRLKYSISDAKVARCFWSTCEKMAKEEKTDHRPKPQRNF